MKEGKYLSEVLDSSQFDKNRMNLIVAQTGQGKTTAATTTLPELLGVQKTRTLFLIDTIMGRENVISHDVAQRWDETEDKIFIMSYAEFGIRLKDHNINSQMFDLIIADEFHNLYKYSKIDEASMWQRNPTFDAATISLMLSRESPNYRAMETLKRWTTTTDIWVFVLTATPQQFLNKDKELDHYIHQVRHGETLVAREILHKYSYGDAKPLLTEETDSKRLLFASTIKQAKQFAETINSETNRNAIALWSRANVQNPMTVEQIQISDYLIANEEFPSNVDDIIATEAYSTGWNLNDERVKEVIIHSGNEILETQFAGRIRHDIEKLYIYNVNEKKNEKKKKEKGMKFEIPNSFFNVWLNKNQRNNLIEEINFPRKWTSLKKWLIENNFSLREKHTKNGDLILIEKNG